MTGPLWSGRLAGGLDPAILDFTASLAVDRRLYREDIAGSIELGRILDELAPGGR